MNALFSIGQKVVCVDSTNTRNLVEGKEYKVIGIAPCAGCGVVDINVGVFLDRNKWTNKCKCGTDTVGNYAWYLQTRFVPLDFDRQADEEIHQALKGVKIETS